MGRKDTGQYQKYRRRKETGRPKISGAKPAPTIENGEDRKKTTTHQVYIRKDLKPGTFSASCIEGTDSIYKLTIL